MSDNRPIGVFDSGVGGLTVVRELFRLMPMERVIYIGDTARCPYGGRSNETIKTFGLQEARFLLAQDVKLLIVACNTVSSVALEFIQEDIKNIPVIGVVLPGCKAAVTRTAENKIGVIGTRATIHSKSYTRGIQNLNTDIKVYGKECPLFVPFVEEGMIGHEITQMVAQYYLYELVDIGIDCLILGCTHYPLLMEVIQDTVSSRIELIDSAMWAAKEAQDILTALNAGCDNSPHQYEQNTFYITDLTPNFKQIAKTVLGTEINTINQINLSQLTALTA